MDWTNQKVIDFIERYKNKPVLWDPKCSKYYNKFAKIDAWDELADEMEITVIDCRRKITSLLSSFRREKMKIKRKRRTAETDDVYESAWFAFNSLAFIMDRSTPRPTSTNTVEELRREPAAAVQNNSFRLANDDEVKNKRRIADTDGSSPSAFSSTGPTKRKKIDCVRDPQHTQHVAFSVSRLSVEGAENEDECVTYGKYIGQKLKSYTTRTKCAVQHAISEVIFKADQGMYEYNNYPPAGHQYSSDPGLSPDVITSNSSPSPSTCDDHPSP